MKTGNNIDNDQTNQPQRAKRLLPNSSMDSL
jgi:hypothetical protein